MSNAADRLRRLRHAASTEPLEYELPARHGDTERLVKVVVASRRRVEQGIGLRVPYALVSISDPEMGEADLPNDQLRLHVLRLQFHDTKRSAREQGLTAGVTPATTEQAKSIRDFVTRHLGEIQALVVHCHQGMSRSPAVAAAICEGLGGDPSFWFEHRLPNKAVFDLMRSVWGEAST